MHLLVRPKTVHLFQSDNGNNSNSSNNNNNSNSNNNATILSSSSQFDDTNKLSLLSNIATGCTSSDIINRILNFSDNNNNNNNNDSRREDTLHNNININNATSSPTATSAESSNENTNKTNPNHFGNNDRDAQALTNLLLGLNAGANNKAVPSMSSIQFLVGPPSSPLSQLSHLAPPNLMGSLGSFNPQMIQPPLPPISASTGVASSINNIGSNPPSGLQATSMPAKIKKSRTHWRPEDILMVKNLLVKYDGLIGSVAHHMEVHHPTIVASHTRGSVRKKIRFLRHELQKKGYFKNSSSRDKLHKIRDESPLLHEHHFDEDEDDTLMDSSSNEDLPSPNSSSLSSASPRSAYATESPVPVGTKLSKEDLRIVSTLNNLQATEVAEKELGLNLSPWVADLPTKFLVVWPLPKREDTQASCYVKNNTVFINYKVKPPSSDDALALQKLLGLDSPISFTNNNEQIYVGKYTLPSDVVPNSAKIHYHSHYSIIELEKLLPYKIVGDKQNQNNDNNNSPNTTSKS